MDRTRSGDMVSAQIGKMGVITDLQTKNFSLVDGQCFNIKNESMRDVQLEVQLVGMQDGEFILTTFGVGWNIEIVKAIKQTNEVFVNLLWGY